MRQVQCLSIPLPLALLGQRNFIVPLSPGAFYVEFVGNSNLGIGAFTMVGFQSYVVCAAANGPTALMFVPMETGQHSAVSAKKLAGLPAVIDI